MDTTSSLDGRRYVLAGADGHGPAVRDGAAETDGDTVTVEGSAELARRMAEAHVHGVCLAFQRVDEHDDNQPDGERF